MISSRLGFRDRRYLVLGSPCGPAMAAARRLLDLEVIVHVACAQALEPRLEACRLGAPAERDAAKLVEELSDRVLQGIVIAPWHVSPATLLGPDDAAWRERLDSHALLPLQLIQGLAAAGRLAAGASLVLCMPDAQGGDLAAAAASAGLQHALFHGRRELLQAGLRVNFLSGQDIDAGPVLFLLSDASRWMTGSLIVADRGQRLRKVPMS
ncbi:hypothetical protein [Bordetella holmesii]|uniref:hypothetical protein n=1 Tax=Bordetella holmesii TaxID=35814 RepID=UPI00045AE0B3|nr:hypothetical protein [Bordetella holmesii]KAK83734.1 hypothetical protein L496_3486 [Bordetella holmesii CDC-H572-BH]QGD90719.1 hypothetical protein FYA74_02260 [Bordetella holmesii]